MLIRNMEPNTVKATAQEKIDTASASAEEKDNASAFFNPGTNAPVAQMFEALFVSSHRNLRLY